MTYDTIATISQTASLLFFMAMFAGVLAYVFWPGNRERLDRAQKRALDLGAQDTNGRGRP